MGNSTKHIKSGMGGSKNGRGRTEPTATLKHESAKTRRVQGKAEVGDAVALVMSVTYAIYCPHCRKRSEWTMFSSGELTCPHCGKLIIIVVGGA